jgi:hypothetical protein
VPPFRNQYGVYTEFNSIAKKGLKDLEVWEVHVAVPLEVIFQKWIFLDTVLHLLPQQTISAAE